MNNILKEAMEADTGEMITVTPECIQGLAEQAFFDGIRIAATVSDDPVFQAKIWALTKSAPAKTPSS
jgi:hypothetical protein